MGDRSRASERSNRIAPASTRQPRCVLPGILARHVPAELRTTTDVYTWGLLVPLSDARTCSRLASTCVKPAAFSLGQGQTLGSAHDLPGKRDRSRCRASPP